MEIDDHYILGKKIEIRPFNLNVPKVNESEDSFEGEDMDIAYQYYAKNAKGFNKKGQNKAGYDKGAVYDPELDSDSSFHDVSGQASSNYNKKNNKKKEIIKNNKSDTQEKITTNTQDDDYYVLKQRNTEKRESAARKIKTNKISTTNINKEHANDVSANQKPVSGEDTPSVSEPKKKKRPVNI